MCGIAKQDVRVPQVLLSDTERPAASEVTDNSVRERMLSNSIINYCRCYLCQWRQVRGKFNISLFIHLLIPQLSLAQGCCRGAAAHSAVALLLRTKALCLQEHVVFYFRWTGYMRVKQAREYCFFLSF